MVKIRLKRMGHKFHAFYRIVAADALAPRDGRFIEELGYYDPMKNETKLEKDLILKWLNLGAQPTETVKSILQKNKIWAEFKQSKIKKGKNKTGNAIKAKASIKSKSVVKKTKPTTKKIKTEAKKAKIATAKK